MVRGTRFISFRFVLIVVDFYDRKGYNKSARHGLDSSVRKRR